MKYVLLTVVAMFSTQVLAESENEPITQAQFEAHQKKQKAVTKKKQAKTPSILSAADLVQDAKKKAGSVFRVMLLGQGIMGIKANKGGGCDFKYLNQDDGGFGPVTGYGFYSFEVAPKDWKICETVSNIEGEDVSSLDLVVQFTALLDTINTVGAKITLPVMRVQKVD